MFSPIINKTMSEYEILKIDKIVNVLEKNKQETISFLEISSEPKISIKDYITRIIKYIKQYEIKYKEDVEWYTPIIFLIIGIEYIKRSKINITKKNMHTLLLTSVVIAYKKWNDDIQINNELFSKIGGVDLKFLNYMEIFFLKKIHYNLFINAKDYYEKISPVFDLTE